MPFRRSLLLALACILLPASATAQQVLHVDPAQSQVHFTLSASMHNVEGTFKVQSGEVTFSDRGGQMSGGVAVDAASGNSGEPKRDHKMTEEQLKAGSFSTVTFAPRAYEGELHATGDSTITVKGMFTLLGQAHEIAVPMSVHRQGDQLKAQGRFQVPFVQWGVKDPSVFMLKVGKEVTVDVTLAGQVSH